MRNKSLLYLLGGLAVGTLLGILFAPDKGESTRHKLSGKGKKMAEDVLNRFRKTDAYQNQE